MRKMMRRYWGIAICLCLLFASVRSVNLYHTSVRCSGCVITEEDAAAFLHKFGWEAEIPAVESVTLTLPKQFDAVYLRYNQLQNDVGLDLAPYAGKQVRRRTYRLKERAPTGEALRANLLLYENQVIAGDVMSVGMNGVMDSLAGKQLH